jgi:hypothetical protein
VPGVATTISDVTKKLDAHGHFAEELQVLHPRAVGDAVVR